MSGVHTACSGFQLYSSRILCFIVARTQVVVSNVTLVFLSFLFFFSYRTLLENARIRLRLIPRVKSRAICIRSLKAFRYFDICLANVLHRLDRFLFIIARLQRSELDIQR